MNNGNEENMEIGFLDAVESEDEMSAAARREEGAADEEDEHGNNSDSPVVSASPPQRARDHAYLPGPSHPLLHDDSLLQRNHSSAKTFPDDPQTDDRNFEVHQAPLTEIPILELPGIVLFPGCTLPIRLRNRPWIQYLGRQIDASRKVGSSDFGRTVQLGILTLEDNHRVAPGQHEQRRRSSWLRRAVTNTRRERRLSSILQQELLGRVESQSEDSEDEHENNSNYQNQRRNLHPFIGRVGTIATVTYTHGDAVLDDQTRRNSAAGVWQQHAEEQGELILKAVGTTRFKVESYLEFQSFADVQVFQVQEYYQDQNPLLQPTSQMMGVFRKLPCEIRPDNNDEASMVEKGETMEDTDQHPSVNTNAVPTKHFVDHHESLIRHLSAVSPVPYLVYQQFWPWRLVGQLMQILEGNKIQNDGDDDSSDDNDSSMDTEGADKSSLLASLAELLHQESPLLDKPNEFSFWMASNMPLSIEEKLNLLQVSCTVERLKLLKAKLVEFALPTVLCCYGCQTQLSRIDSVFTVGGADGTTGNYVNEHGFIHQVMTLRQVRESRLFCAGQASTENSYFPGYSWTVTYCNRCGSLLGWKFNWVGGGGRTRPKNSGDYPTTFFGFMSSSLVTRSR